MSMLSIPRDTRVLINGFPDKINHAHSYGGIDMTLDVVNEFLGTDIEYYVKLDYNAVRESVDAIGGVEVKVPRRMTYDNLAEKFWINLYPGLQRLDGDGAMQLIRWRQSSDGKNAYDDGDLGRIETQQMFMEAFIHQAMDISNITKLPSIVRTGYNNVDTNLPFKDIMNGVLFAKDFSNKELRTETVPGTDTYIDEISYYLPDKRALVDLMEDLGLQSKGVTVAPDY